MSNDQDLYQEGKKAPTADPNPESGSDDIIELTDVVSEGKDPLDFEVDAPLLLDEEKPEPEQAEFGEAAIPEGMETPSVTEAKPEEAEDVSSQDDFSALESSDFKFENTSTFDDADREPFPEQSQEHLDDVLAGLEKEVSAFEKPEDILADLERDDPEDHQIEQSDDFFSDYDASAEDEDPSDMPPILDGEENEGEEPGISAVSQDIPGISEEKMKELLTEVVQETFAETAEKVIRDSVEQTIRQAISEIAERVMDETVEKAVRETVSETAEKVIREAIDTLKKSIASTEL